MQPDVTRLHHWYASPLGDVAQATIRAYLGQLWPDVTAERLLVLGYGEPYLDLWPKAQACWGMPAAMGGYTWPEDAPCQSLLLHPHQLPFANHTFDRILLIHALEFSPVPEALLAECHRVMYPAGHLMIVAPNRLGAWARRDGTPFALGTPYSGGALRKLLRNSSFTPLHLSSGLFMPPVQTPLVQHRAQWWEKTGRYFASPMGGVLFAEASKDVLGGRVVRVRDDKLGLLPVVRPQTAGV